MECHLGNMVDQLEVRAAIVSEVEEKLEISSAAQKTLELSEKSRLLDSKRTVVRVVTVVGGNGPS